MGIWWSDRFPIWKEFEEIRFYETARSDKTRNRGLSELTLFNLEGI
ncbi:MAG: hypothetical protein F6K35_48000 [Okeania sp. SIO2H7]|nr:hypothetical protein [Okeania sp. SIO2H7]